MFESFMDLPIHMLILHFVVVLVPLAAMITSAVCVVPKWRARFMDYVAGANVALFLLTFVTVRSGIALKNKMDPSGKSGIPTQDHEGWGTALMYVVLAVAIVAVLTAAIARMDIQNPTALTGLGLLVAALALAAAGVTMVTGHTGAKSHWGYLYESRG